ncbi:MAG: hypothetical protein L0Z68_09075 [Gammaproteobacteria bacterium]|nr:hypothetical protein [Gammaproteobacteria bacterium]
MLYINRARKNWLILNARALLLLFVALPLGLPAYTTHAATPHSRKDGAQDAVATELSIQSDQDRINARILNTSLDRVCRELAQKTGVQCVLNPSAATLPVSATATNLPLRDAIKKILAGFSYAIYPADANGKLILNVLANRKDSDLKKPAIAPRTEYASAVSYSAPLPPAPIAATPQSLQEDQPVEMHIDREVQSESEWDPQSREQM